MAGPLIGIAGASYVVRRPFGPLAVHGIPTSYVEQVIAAGARPVLLPPGAGHLALEVLDGLVLAGGGDVDPSLYGGDAAARDVDRQRDDAEVRLVRAAREAGVPTLGVCRGAQVFAVMDGGTLVADVPHVLPGVGHQISTAAGSVCRELLGSRTTVSSLHHQAVASTGPAWRVTCTADDGVVEAVEWEGSAWAAVGVLWHPEMDATGPALFGWLVSRAAGVAAGRAAGRAGDVIRNGSLPVSLLQ
jgi:putative glutamine amidotransferase